MPIWLLLSMQASGMIFDYFGTQNQQRLYNMGAKLNAAGLEANIQQTRLETEDASLQALKNLRKAMGTQIAVFAARGQSTSAGSALALMTESVGNFNADERTRRLNLVGKENTLKAGGLINQLNQSSENSKLWQGFAQRTINRVPTNPSAYSFGSGSGSSASSYGTKATSSYGLTRVGN